MKRVQSQTGAHMKVNRWFEAREKEGDNKEEVRKAVKALYLKVK